MTKPKDIPFEERWPTLTKIVPRLMPIAFVWIFYQGLAMITASHGWPLTFDFLSQSPPETYQEYVRHWQESQQVTQWFMGPVFVLAPLVIFRRRLFRLVRRMLNRRTEEVQKEE